MMQGVIGIKHMTSSRMRKTKMEVGSMLISIERKETYGMQITGTDEQAK
jgi:hypothetical protein